ARPFRERESGCAGKSLCKSLCKSLVRKIFKSTEVKFRQGDTPSLVAASKYELIGASDDEVLVFVDGDSGEKIGLYCHDRLAGEFINQLYDLVLNDKRLRKFITVLHRLDAIMSRSQVGHGGNRGANGGVEQLSYMTGWAGANHFKRQPLPRLTSATVDDSYGLVSGVIDRLAAIAADRYQSVLPELFAAQREAILTNRLKLGHKELDTGFYQKLWTSMIFNVDTAAAVHMDRRNLASLNAIFCLRRSSVLTGGQLMLCDYRIGSRDGAWPVFRQNTGDLILYPAYRSYHGVTPLYGRGRATLVFYALKLAQGDQFGPGAT
ncbi:MAG: hypothetical protein QXZ51_05040, partial [Candidatus Bathyarchaeia archaeon]